MTARTDEVVLEIDDLCEHPFLIRVMGLSIVGYNFNHRDEVEEFPDAIYLLSIDARTSIFRRRLRSIQRLLVDLSKELNISIIPFSLHGLLDVFGDAAYMRISSVADLLLLISREVLEIPLADIDTTFGNMSRRTADKTILPFLGKICDPNRAFRSFRNSRIHSGFENGFDDYDPGFEMASLFRERGQGLRVMSQTIDSEVSLSDLYESRRLELLQEFLTEVMDLVPDITALLDLLASAFEDRFTRKTKLPSSFMARQKIRYEP